MKQKKNKISLET